MRSRVIKFRAWDKRKEKMYIPKRLEWAPIGLLTDRRVAVVEGNHSTDPDMGTHDEPIVLMQFTGLTDKNGKEIYEGDIILCASAKKCPHEVVWMNEVPSTAFLGGGMPGFYLSGLVQGYAFLGDEEIIGNIYENPDLLNQHTP